MWLGRIIGNPVAPKPVYALNKKRMPKHPLSNVAGTGLEPVSESACAPRRSGYEPEVLIPSVKQKRMPKHPFQCSGNRTRTCVRRGGYEP